MTNRLNVSTKRDNRLRKFRNRFLLDVGWLILINTLLVFFIIRGIPFEYSWIVVLFFFTLFVFESYSSWKNEKYLLMLLKVSSDSNSVHVVVNKFDEVHLDETYPISSISVELKELRFGQLFVPNYMLVLKNQGNLILKQRGNAVWKRTEIKKITEQLKSIVKQTKALA